MRLSSVSVIMKMLSNREDPVFLPTEPFDFNPVPVYSHHGKRIISLFDHTCKSDKMYTIPVFILALVDMPVEISGYRRRPVQDPQHFVGVPQHIAAAGTHGKMTKYDRILLLTFSSLQLAGKPLQLFSTNTPVPFRRVGTAAFF